MWLFISFCFSFSSHSVSYLILAICRSEELLLLLCKCVRESRKKLRKRFSMRFLLHFCWFTLESIQMNALFIVKFHRKIGWFLPGETIVLHSLFRMPLLEYVLLIIFRRNCHLFSRPFSVVMVLPHPNSQMYRWNPLQNLNHLPSCQILCFEQSQNLSEGSNIKYLKCVIFMEIIVWRRELVNCKMNRCQCTHNTKDRKHLIWASSYLAEIPIGKAASRLL